MKTKLMLIACALAIGLLFAAPQYADAQSINTDGHIVFLNQTESGFATVILRPLQGANFELRLNANHPDKNAMMALILTAMSQDWQVRIRWIAGPPNILNRVSVDLR